MRTLASRKIRWPHQRIRQHRIVGRYRDKTCFKNMGLVSWLFFFAYWVNPMSAHATPWYTGEFSADVVLTDPRAPQNKVHGTFHVGKDRFRAEGLFQGKRSVLIVRPLDRMVWTLFPEDKTYYAGPGKMPIPPKPDLEQLPGDADSPCQQDRALSCTSIGSESLHGIQTEKWHIVYQGHVPVAGNRAQPLERKATLWADPSRHIVIRQQPEGGPLMERTLIATERINGRETEKWTFVHSFQGQSQRYVRWVDVQLRVPVREERNGTVVMELLNVHARKQPADLFEVPKAFREIQPPRSFQGEDQPVQGQPGSGPPVAPLPERDGHKDPYQGGQPGSGPPVAPLPSGPSGRLHYH